MKTTLALALMGTTLLAVPVMAQTTGTTDTTRTPAVTAPAPKTATSPLFEMRAGQWRSTKLTGLAVYDPRNERIGEINELIVGRDGRIAAIVVGVGGFLGIGEHNAAIPFEQVQWIDEPVNRAVSGTPATGMTGTSSPAPVDRAAGANGERTIATDSRVNQNTGTVVTTTTTERPAATTPMADRAATREAYRGYPDHAVVNMTKEQLKVLPQVRYER